MFPLSTQISAVREVEISRVCQPGKQRSKFSSSGNSVTTNRNFRGSLILCLQTECHVACSQTHPRSIRNSDFSRLGFLEFAEKHAKVPQTVVQPSATVIGDLDSCQAIFHSYPLGIVLLMPAFATELPAGWVIEVRQAKSDKADIRVLPYSDRGGLSSFNDLLGD